MYSTDPAKRAELISGLRAMADYLDANPELPIPSEIGSEIFVSIDGTDDHKRAEIARLADLLDVTPSWGEHYRAIRSFGPLTYRAVAIPQAARAEHDARRSYDTNIQTAA